MNTTANPFSVTTPENLGPSELVELFVPFPEFAHVQQSGHHFLHGHRGSGKSMMLRMMEPECLVKLLNCSPQDIPYFGCYLSIKATEINQPEFERFDRTIGGYVLAEHLLAMKILAQVIFSVHQYQTMLSPDDSQAPLASSIRFRDKCFVKYLERIGWETEKFSDAESKSTLDILTDLMEVTKSIQAHTLGYVRRQSFLDKVEPYSGPLLGFQDTLLPIIRGLREEKLVPDKAYYVLLDDADNLTVQQTKVLNTWVSYRSTATVSLKISTQLGYKSWTTSGGVPIESPHDFSELHFTTVRTGANKSRYFDMVSDIVKKRLVKYGFTAIQPKDYFPEDKQQAIAIELIEEELRTKWDTSEKRGYRPNDDSYRAARPEYIRRLLGTSKQGATYKYAGFDQLVHISSGTIRFFLDPAAKMYSQAIENNNNVPAPYIAPDIQDECIRAQSNSLILSAFENLKDEVKSRSSGEDDLRDIDYLRNLTNNIGSLFQSYLLDPKASQRRIFSFHIAQDDPTEILRRILNLGIKYGYFYQSSIGNKSGSGRSTLYVLTRRLAPAFKLDPIGFSGYLSITSEELATYMLSPIAWKRKARNVAVEQGQLSLDYIQGASA